ncbi:CoA transferase subunit A [Bacillus sp. B-jedd]|uniref:CoA transferase subunit A n=1 Tax=Bacillus sp. B-jedd TaxID=1476857 RepID=UPI00051556ED|nr:CoA transferase subunit A [Bacillus sp. B-jedd]CEG27426.1 succinyl-CoA:3-ketoacid-coenzyme A transferase subunit A [Bacillus sp. B-jedd]
MALPVESEKLRTPEEAVELLSEKNTVMVGGFGLCGTPFTLIDAISENASLRELTIISNNLGESGKGLGILLQTRQIKKAVGSYFTSNRDAVKAWKAGNLEIELYPQGSFIEAIRAGGAGIAAFYVKTGVGTELAKGKEERLFKGERNILIEAIRADASLIRAWKADSLGNLVYSKSARNFNPAMATASDLVIAEVDEIVPAGSLDPESIITPHTYVDVLVLSRYEKAGGFYVKKHLRP